MNNFFRRMSQLGLPPLTMRRMWVCYRHAWPAAINRCQSLAAIYQWCDPRQSSTYIYIDLSLICINLYQLSSNYCPLYTNHSKYIQVFFLSSILHMQCTSWLWYSYIITNYNLGLSLMYWAIITLVFQIIYHLLLYYYMYFF